LTGKLLHVVAPRGGLTQMRYRVKYFAASVSWKRITPRSSKTP